MAIHELLVHEQALLLSLSDTDGAPAFGASHHYAIAGAAISELVIHRKLSIEGSTKDTPVRVKDASPTDHPVLDDFLKRINASNKEKSVASWISELAETKGLVRHTALGLCDLGILREGKAKLIGIIPRDAWPMIDPEPKREIVERLRAAIFGDEKTLDERTAILVTLANSAGLLALCFEKGELKARAARIEEISRGDSCGEATRAAIEAVESAMVIGVMVATL